MSYVLGVTQGKVAPHIATSDGHHNLAFVGGLGLHQEFPVAELAVRAVATAAGLSAVTPLPQR